jgi:hypothetical protein
MEGASKMCLVEKLAAVEAEIGWTLSSIGFNQRYLVEWHNLTQELVLVSRNQVVVLYLEVREGYMDLKYGPLDCLRIEHGTVAGLSYERTKSFRRQLFISDIKVPGDNAQFYEPGIAESAIKLLLLEGRKRSKEVFGVEDPALG